MIEKRIRARLARSVVYGSLAAGIVVVACDAPAPQMPGESEVEPSVASFDPAAYDRALPEADVQDVPERISCPRIDYPRMLQQAGIQGRVIARFVVGTDGKVVPRSVTIVQSDHRAFEGPAKDMIARCRFTPGKLHGEAVNVAVNMPISFTLSRPDGRSDVRSNSASSSVSHDRNAITVTAGHRVSVTSAMPLLYVVDGLVQEEKPDVDALDIETIGVVQGDAAQRRYGSRARHGVIVITTKKE